MIVVGEVTDAFRKLFPQFLICPCPCLVIVGECLACIGIVKDIAFNIAFESDVYMVLGMIAMIWTVIIEVWENTISPKNS